MTHCFTILMRIFFVGMSFFWIFSSCSEPVYTPKPRMYPYVNYPEYQFDTLDLSNCPFRFAIPSYVQVERDSTFFEEKVENACWLNLQYQQFNGTLHCSYFDLNNAKQLEKCIKDSYKLAREHQKKANFIDEHVILKPNGLYGLLYNIEGPVASPFQFYLTDSSHHFFRAALYFNSPPRPDSIQPIAEFIKKDLLEMINSFEWKNH